MINTKMIEEKYKDIELKIISINEVLIDSLTYLSIFYEHVMFVRKEVKGEDKTNPFYWKGEKFNIENHLLIRNNCNIANNLISQINNLTNTKYN